MVKGPEQRLADALAKHFDSLSMKNRLAAYFTINEMTPAQQTQFFDFMMHCIFMFAEDTMEGFVGMDRAERNLISLEIKEAIDRAGYHFRD